MELTLKINAGNSPAEAVQQIIKKNADFFEQLRKDHPDIEIHIEVNISEAI